MNLLIRPARPADRSAVATVEAGATPNLSYVSRVFDLFLSHKQGEFCVAEIDNKVVACGKFTVVPDGSAWLETIRVLPEYQGRGIGKRFYERFFEIAHAQNVTTMRMYTGTKNVVSKGLAEHFGFQLAETFIGASLTLPTSFKQVDFEQVDLEKDAPTFRPVTDPAEATQLLLAQSDDWSGFLVMNRTFYTLTPELCAALVDNNQVYADATGESMIVVGARFMPEMAQHVGCFSGDAASCMKLAARIASKNQCNRLSCLFPIAATNILQCLNDCGFSLEKSEFIVMERHLRC